MSNQNWSYKKETNFVQGEPSITLVLKSRNHCAGGHHGILTVRSSHCSDSSLFLLLDNSSSMEKAARTDNLWVFSVLKLTSASIWLRFCCDYAVELGCNRFAWVVFITGYNGFMAGGDFSFVYRFMFAMNGSGTI